jgi:hypothetical protein
MKVLTFVRHVEQQKPTAPPASLMAAMDTFIEKHRKTGRLVDTGGLTPTAQGKKFRIAKGALTVTDGPFTEGKEVIGGYAILEGTPDEVMTAAREWVDLHLKHWPEFEFECEYRPMFGHNEGPDWQ